MRFKRIFCALDELAGSDAAWTMATELARDEAWLLVGHAVDPHAPAGGEHELELLRRSLATKVPRVETVTLAGPPAWSALTSEAARWKADLLVLGGTRRESFARDVLRHAPCSVLVVRGAARPLRRLLCAVDFSEPARRAWSATLELAAERNADLGLVHAIPERDGGRAAAEAALRRWTAALEPSVRPQTSAAIVEGAAGAAVAEAARRGEYDLIVAGTGGGSGAAPARIGSVAESIVHRADRPVLIVR